MSHLDSWISGVWSRVCISSERLDDICAASPWATLGVAGLSKFLLLTHLSGRQVVEKGEQ